MAAQHAPPARGNKPHHVCVIYCAELSPDKWGYYKAGYMLEAFQTSLSPAEPVPLHRSPACLLFSTDTSHLRSYHLQAFCTFSNRIFAHTSHCIHLSSQALLTSFDNAPLPVTKTSPVLCALRVYTSLQLYPFQSLSTWKEVKNFIQSSQPYSQKEFASICHKGLKI